MPPAALERSKTVTSMPSTLRCAAATTPLMPAPTTATLFEGMVIAMPQSREFFRGVVRLSHLIASHDCVSWVTIVHSRIPPQDPEIITGPKLATCLSAFSSHRIICAIVGVDRIMVDMQAYASPPTLHCCSAPKRETAPQNRIRTPCY
jgi:hypothetical protein